MGAYSSYARWTCLFSSTTSTLASRRLGFEAGSRCVRIARVSYPLPPGIAKPPPLQQKPHQQGGETQEREEAEHVGERGDDHARRDGGVDAKRLQRDRHQ